MQTDIRRKHDEKPLQAKVLYMLYLFAISVTAATAFGFLLKFVLVSTL